MGWTERKVILTSYKEIVNYLENADCFHDYRIGFIKYIGSEADVTIEEVLPGAKTPFNTGLIWDFHFKNVTSFAFSVDTIPEFWIDEVKQGEKPNEIAFHLHSGFLGVAAEQITFGIPSKKEE